MHTQWTRFTHICIRSPQFRVHNAPKTVHPAVYRCPGQPRPIRVLEQERCCSPMLRVSSYSYGSSQSCLVKSEDYSWVFVSSFLTVRAISTTHHSLHDILKGKPNAQMSYQVCFCFWLLTFEQEVAENIDKCVDQTSFESNAFSLVLQEIRHHPPSNRSRSSGC